MRDRLDLARLFARARKRVPPTNDGASRPLLPDACPWTPAQLLDDDLDALIGPSEP